MGKYFPKLTQTQVFIQTDTDGNGFNCQMLPVSALQQMNDFSERLTKVTTVEEFEAIRKDMIDFVKKVIPVEYHENIQRFDIPRLTELIAYLMYGDVENDDQPKKN